MESSKTSQEKKPNPYKNNTIVYESFTIYSIFIVFKKKKKTQINRQTTKIFESKMYYKKNINFHEYLLGSLFKKKKKFNETKNLV